MVDNNMERHISAHFRMTASCSLQIDVSVEAVRRVLNCSSSVPPPFTGEVLCSLHVLSLAADYQPYALNMVGSYLYRTARACSVKHREETAHWYKLL